mmetsp:Transcript_2525/g.4069  ORF Transcript_2525/g.4069 Transcript_2525/m.4069 type:complete len:698 (+) Transcript_2525:20-2113(+)
MGFFFVTSDAERCKKICKQAARGDAEKLVHYMRKHIDNPLMMSATCTTFNTMCMNANHRHKLDNAGGVDLLCRILRLHGGFEGVEEPAVQALCRIINNENRQQIVRHDGVNLVIQSMTKWPNSVVIQEAGPSALGSMAEEDEAVQDTIGISGGVKVILAAIKNHPRSPVVVRNGVTALYQIGSLWKKNQLKIAAEGGCKCISEAVYRHYCDVRILTPGLKVLQMLASRDENVAKIAKENGVFTIVDTMCRHHDEAFIQQHGCYALAQLGKDANTKPTISEEGGLAAVLSAIKNHRDNAGVQAGAFEAVTSLAEDSSMHKMEIMRDNGIRLILDSMKSHKEVATVQSAGCKAIGMLATTQANKMKIAKENAIQVILQSMNRFNISASVVEEGIRALLNLTSSSPTNVKIALENGGAGCIKTCMKKHGDSDMMQDIGREAIALLNGEIKESSLNASRSTKSDGSFHSQHDTPQSSKHSREQSHNKFDNNSPENKPEEEEEPQQRPNNLSLMSITSEDRLDTARRSIETPRLDRSIEAGISPQETQIELTPVKPFSSAEAFSVVDGDRHGTAANDLSLVSMTTADEGLGQDNEQDDLIDPEESEIEIADDDESNQRQEENVLEEEPVAPTPPRSFIKKVRGLGMMPRYVAASPAHVAKRLQLPKSLNTKKAPPKPSCKSPIPEGDEGRNDRSPLLQTQAV